jgi:diguanylate cyclase (GGDEF)-like protein/PAS domain S-box-containing protein
VWIGRDMTSPYPELQRQISETAALEKPLTDAANGKHGDRRLGPRRSAEGEYRSLFENAVCGIYRDALDGTPVRCNPALAALNGYASEAEYISAVSGAHGAWYVKPERSAEFKQQMLSEGRVRDFVSQVYRHKSRERFWITENAWYVRDMDGNPIFIEGTIQDATERITTMAIVERQANIDSLTGVASRFRFMNALHAQTMEGAKECALFSIDLDRFKEVNDTLGHAAGDFVLCQSAGRLEEIADGHGLVARLGGDEFALLLPGLIDGAALEDLAGKIIAAMREPVQISGQNLIVGCSVGIASYPLHANDAEELLANADLALYSAKLAGRNGFCLFDAEMRIASLRNKELEGELRAAIAGDELELYYQPIVDGSTGAVQAFEALMRWNHPTRGFMMPAQFILLAEEAGLMTELGNWAITRACEQAAVLPDNIQVAVNVSPNQFRSASIISHLRQVLAETGLDPARLILEITESVILSSEMIAERVMSELQFLGVQLALDDFGTGYSSLSYLQRYAFSKVKIDRMFVAGMLEQKANLAIVRAILSIGRDLGIGIVAEGVEKIEQAEALRDEGCVLMQGYLFGRPKPLNDIICDLAVQELAAIQICAPETLEEKRWA